LKNSRLGWDIGIGLTIATPLGPVRLDYAVPHIDGKMNLSNGKINFGVQYLF
jgi:outer membrane translocation and assembly module TamA